MPPCPQPSSFGTQYGCDIGVTIDIYVTKDAGVARVQPTSGHGSPRHSLTSDQRVFQRGTVPRVARSVTSVVEREVSFTLDHERKANFTLGAEVVRRALAEDQPGGRNT